MKLCGLALLATLACANAHDAHENGKRQSYKYDSISEASNHIGVMKETDIGSADTTVTMTATVFPEAPYPFNSSSSSVANMASPDATVTVTHIISPEPTGLTYTSKWSNSTDIATSYGATVIVTATINPEGSSIPMSTAFSDDAATATNSADATVTVTIYPEVSTVAASATSSEHGCTKESTVTSASMSLASGSETMSSITPVGTYTVSLTWSLNFGGYTNTTTMCHETGAVSSVSAVSAGVGTVTNAMGWPAMTPSSSVEFTSSVDPVTASAPSKPESSMEVTIIVTPTSTIHITETVMSSESDMTPSSESVDVSSNTVSHETIFSTIASTVTVPGTTSMTTETATPTILDVTNESCMSVSTVYAETTIVTSTLVIVTGPTEVPTGVLHDTVFVTITEYAGIPSSSYPGLPSSAGGMTWTDTFSYPSSASCTSTPWTTVYVTAQETETPFSYFSTSEIAVPVTSTIAMTKTYTTASTDGIAISEPTTSVFSGFTSLPWSSIEIIPSISVTQAVTETTPSVTFSIEPWTSTLSVPGGSLITSITAETLITNHTVIMTPATAIPTVIIGTGNVTFPAYPSMTSPVLISDGGVSASNLLPRVPRSIWGTGSGGDGGASASSHGTGTMCVVMLVALVGVLVL